MIEGNTLNIIQGTQSVLTMQPMTPSLLWRKECRSDSPQEGELSQPLREQTDEQLMLLCQKGVSEALEELFRRYSRPLYQYIYRRLLNADTAADLVQEVFLRLYTHRKQYKPTSCFSYWIYRIAHNLCVDEKRRYWNRNVVEASNMGTEEYGADFMELQPSSQINSAEVLEEKQMEEIIRNAIEQLSDEQRQVMVLHKYQGLAYKEIADILGISTESVKQRSYRAHLKLRDLLKPILKEREA